MDLNIEKQNKELEKLRESNDALNMDNQVLISKLKLFMDTNGDEVIGICKHTHCHTHQNSNTQTHTDNITAQNINYNLDAHNNNSKNNNINNPLIQNSMLDTNNDEIKNKNIKNKKHKKQQKPKNTFTHYQHTISKSNTR